MITLRRGAERYHERRRKQDLRLTFHPSSPTDAVTGGFGALERFNEHRLLPGTGIPRGPPHDAEIITYVYEGTLAFEDSVGRSGVIPAGEFHRLTAVRGLRHSVTNASRTDPAHAFRMWLRPTAAELEPGQEQRRFSAAERRNGLCVVASPDARGGSLRIRQDVLVYSAVLYLGQHVVHELAPERSAWVHLVQGEVTLGGLVLTTGDSAGITGELAVSVTAREETEILLIDLGGPQPVMTRADVSP